MIESTLILKYLEHSYPDTHQAVFMYVKGTSIGYAERCRKTTEKILAQSEIIFSPSFSKEELYKIIKEYLENKRRQYLTGKIQVKSIY